MAFSKNNTILKKIPASLEAELKKVKIVSHPGKFKPL